MVGERWALELPRDASAVPRARRALAQDADLLGDRADDARLLVTELVSNAVRHGRGTIELRALKIGRTLRYEVVDEGLRGARPRRLPDPGEHGGWGLRIVGALADRWGYEKGSTRVWVELDV